MVILNFAVVILNSAVVILNFAVVQKSPKTGKCRIGPVKIVCAWPGGKPDTFLVLIQR